MNTHRVWPHTEIGFTFSSDPAYDAELRERIDAKFQAMMRDLNTSMYGDLSTPKKRSWRYRLIEFKWRAQDAWRALTGNAGIC